MADPLEARICNWILELLAHTFGCLCALPEAGAVPAGALESFPDGIDNLLIGIELDFHVRHLFLDCGFIIPQDKVFFCDEVTLIKKSGAFGAPDQTVDKVVNGLFKWKKARKRQSNVE